MDAKLFQKAFYRLCRGQLWPVLSVFVNSRLVAISRVTGEVLTKTHMDSFGVNRDFRFALSDNSMKRFGLHSQTRNSEE
jgi:hypothetical protein